MSKRVLTIATYLNLLCWYSCNSADLTTPETVSTKSSIIRHNNVFEKLNRFGFTNGSRISSSMHHDYCWKQARCQLLNYTTCFGIKLPYTSTSLDLVIGDVRTQEQVQYRLTQWQSAQNIPKCWAVIQPLLCALYMPNCNNDLVVLPSQEMCKITRGPCSIIAKQIGWPEFLQCEDTEQFPSKCKNDVRELKFNTSSQCISPLSSTDISESYYDGMEGCGIQCQNPIYTEEEYDQIRTFIGVTTGICMASSLFTMLTFLISWRSSNKYPAVIVFYINACYFFVCCGWMAQFVADRRTIVCRKDGTLRMNEPSSGQNMSCVVVFILVYYFLLAFNVWIVMLAYAWDISFKALGKIREEINKRAAYFHLISWSVPLVFTITTMALGQVDADSVTGICFVSNTNPYVRFGFVLAPIGLALSIVLFFILRGLFTLFKLKSGSKELISDKASAKIHETIIRMALFALLLCAFYVIGIICHLYEYKNRHDWEVALRKYIVCKSNVTTVLGNDNHFIEPCKLSPRPNTAFVELHILALFGAGILLASWVWTKGSIDAWKTLLKRKCLDARDAEPVRMKKHKVIAQAFAKRKHLHSAGRISISYHSNHNDPIGMNLDLSSGASQEVSSAWAAALPQFMARRGAIIAASSVGSRRNSMDSNISFTVRRFSIDSQQDQSSRRHSLDSQISLRLSEVERLAAIHAKAVSKGNSNSSTIVTKDHHRRRHRDAYGRRSRMRVGPLFRRRGSITSQDSTIGSQSQVLPAITITSRPSSRRSQHPTSSLLAHNSGSDANDENNTGFSFDPGREISLLLESQKQFRKRREQEATQGHLDEKLQKFLQSFNSSGTESVQVTAPAIMPLPALPGPSTTDVAIEITEEKPVHHAAVLCSIGVQAGIMDQGTQTSWDILPRRITTPRYVDKSVQISPGLGARRMSGTGSSDSDSNIPITTERRKFYSNSSPHAATDYLTRSHSSRYNRKPKNKSHSMGNVPQKQEYEMSLIS